MRPNGKEFTVNEHYDDDIAMFIGMTDDDVKDMILWLMIKEEAYKRLTKYGTKDLDSQPI